MEDEIQSRKQSNSSFYHRIEESFRANKHGVKLAHTLLSELNVPEGLVCVCV